MIVGMNERKLARSSRNRRKLARPHMNSQQKLAWSGALVMTAAIVGFVVYIAVAGLNNASELAGVVSALIALAGLGLAAAGVAARKHPPELAGPPVVKTAIAGSGPWKIDGYGVTYEVRAVTRSAKRGKGESKCLITVTAYVTRTQSSGHSDIEYRFHDVESGKKLTKVHSESSGEKTPPLNQPRKLVTVLEDINPPVQSLRITVKDFFWPDGPALVLDEVPVSL